VGAAANAALDTPSTSSAGAARSNAGTRRHAWVVQRPPRRCPKLITAGAQINTRT
jgi:hypothetical protein